VGAQRGTGAAARSGALPRGPARRLDARAASAGDVSAAARALDRAGYTAAANCLADDLDALVVHLRYPTRHRRRWRSTNLLERSLGEVKRRTKVIGRFPGETSCLTLVWAVLDLYISNATNGIRFSQLERQRLKRLRYEGHEPEPTTAEEVNAA
jgi:transposase-like protein